MTTCPTITFLIDVHYGVVRDLSLDQSHDPETLPAAVQYGIDGAYDAIASRLGTITPAEVEDIAWTLGARHYITPSVEAMP